MKGFFERLQWRLASWMQGRYGNDNLSSFLLALAIISLILSVIPGLDLFSWLTFLLMLVSVFRTCSKNIAARSKENDTYERLATKPKHWYSVARKAWVNRKTTRYFKCKGCGTVLSVPRGKGKLRVVCPKCKTETMKKS